MKFVRCPHCRRIKFLDEHDKPFWVKLSPGEECVLEIIPASFHLEILVDKFEEYPEYCDDCDLVEKN